MPCIKDRHPDIFRRRPPSPYRTDDGGKLLLRLALGVALLRFGYASEDPANTSLFVQYGVPGFVAYGLYPWQFLAPLSIILGLFCRIGALAAGLQSIVAAVSGRVFSPATMHCAWTINTQSSLLVMCAAIVLMGAGRYSLGGHDGRWN